MLQFDPTKPLGSCKKAWSKLTTKAGLKGLRFHDCRHTAITTLLTNPKVSEQTVKAIAGHVDKRMIDRYSHIRLQDKRDAVLDTFTASPAGNLPIATQRSSELNTVNTVVHLNK